MKEFCLLRKSKVIPARNYDVYYDKTVALPGAKDYYREAGKAMSTATEYKLCPDYSAMFSDTRPRHVMVPKRYGKVPELYETWKANQESLAGVPERPVDVRGSQRTLFFTQPTQHHLQPTSVVMVHLQTMASGEGLYPVKSIMRRRKSSVVAPTPAKAVVTLATKSTQTDYRESETQTLPWAHDFISLQEEDEELLAFAWFKSEENVPVGVHEVTLIERARQKLAWETAFPRVKDKRTEMRRKSLIAMIETNDTSFRETEIEAIHQLRIALSKQKLDKSKKESEIKLQRRLERLLHSKRMENYDKVHYWNHQFLRTMRKLSFDRKKISQKYHKWDIVTIHKDKTSELYAPQLRFGENPSRRHETIDIQCRYLKRFRGFEILEQRASRSPRSATGVFDYNEASKPKKAGEMCPRAICYTEEGLEKLHSDIKAIRSKQEEKHVVQEMALRKPLPVPEPEAPIVEDISDWREDIYQTSLILSKTLKGRAVQTRFLTTIAEIAEKSDEAESETE